MQLGNSNLMDPSMAKVHYLCWRALLQALVKFLLLGDTCLICESSHAWKKCLICLLIARHIPSSSFSTRRQRKQPLNSAVKEENHMHICCLCLSPGTPGFNAIWCIPGGSACLLLIKKKLKDLCWD